MYKISENCWLTPYHPFLNEKGNFFPIDNNIDQKEYEGYVYDIILQNRGLIKVNDSTYAASLGHNCTLNSFKHDYLGSENVINDALKVEKFTLEIVETNRSENGLIIKMKFF